MSGNSFPHNMKNHHVKHVSGQSSSAPSTPTVILNRQNIKAQSKPSPNTNTSSNKVCRFKVVFFRSRYKLYENDN